jgi:tetratricopeptide (TPR) repeat protein
MNPIELVNGRSMRTRVEPQKPYFLLTGHVLVAVVLLCASSFSQSGEQRASDRPFDDWIQMGVAAARNGDLKTAKQAFQQAVSLRPRDPRALTALGQVQEQLGEYSASIQTFREVLEIDAASPEAHVNLAIALADQGDLNDGLKQTEQAINLNPNSSEAHSLRGRLLNDLGRRADARQEFRGSLQIAPRNAEALRYWAALEEDEGNVGVRIDLLRRYILVRPKDAYAQFQYGQLMEDAHREPEAIAAWKRVLTLNPDYREAIYSLARAVRKSDPQESKKLLDRVSALEHDQQTDDRVRMLGNLANEKMAESQFPGAIEDLKQAIMLCGRCEHLGALEKNFGLAYCHKGELDFCQRELKIAQSLIPDDPTVALALRVAKEQQQSMATAK